MIIAFIGACFIVFTLHCADVGIVGFIVGGFLLLFGMALSSAMTEDSRARYNRTKYWANWKEPVNRENKQMKGTRIDHPHYVTDDEYECSVCGRRFMKNVLTCPCCGAVFTRVVTNNDEWAEEFDEECDMDEEEGW